MNIYNNRLFEWCKTRAIKQAEIERLKAGMAISDEDQYNRTIQARAKISFWYWVLFVPFLLIMFIRMVL